MARYKLEWYDGEDEGFSILRNADLETVQYLTDHLLRSGVRSVTINEDRLDEPLADWERELLEGSTSLLPRGPRRRPDLDKDDDWPPTEPTRYGIPIHNLRS